jgi:hydroxymethylpyrimidine/phosphomethylpyrimidine kinase
MAPDTPVPAAMTIAGSDSGGGAGIQADLKTFAVHGVFGTSAITALTAQNTLGVTQVLPIDAAMVRAQIDAVLSDLTIHAIKIGMLATAGIAAVVADALDEHPDIPVVLDTVMVAKGGARLLDETAVTVIKQRLMRRATIVTANIPETEVLTGLTLRSPVDLAVAAKQLVGDNVRAVLVKGGHLAGEAVDVYYDGRDRIDIGASRIDTRHTHGTGCTLAAAIAAEIALGRPLLDAVQRAKRYVTRAIAAGPGIGQGHGPLGWGPALVG